MLVYICRFLCDLYLGCTVLYSYISRKRKRKAPERTPPQPSVRARSLPVPSGRTATGGGGDMPSASIIERIQPTVPSPPQHSTRRFGTFRYSSSLRTASGQLQSARVHKGALHLQHAALALVFSATAKSLRTLHASATLIPEI